MVASESTPINAEPAPTTPCPPELPEFLRPGGTVDTLMAEAMRRRSSICGTDWLQETINKNVRSIRFAYANLMSQPDYGDSSPSDTFCRAFQSPMLSADMFDRVLHVSLAHFAGVDLTQETHDTAFRKFLNKRDQYLAIMGDLVPERYRRAADAKIRRDAYENGTNPTAADDWGTFAEKFSQDDRQGGMGLIRGTNLPALDASLNGLDGVTFVGGTKGVGKTTLMMLMMVAALRADPNVVVLIYTLDIPKMRLIERLICHVAGVAFRTLKKGGLDVNASPEVQRSVAHVRDDILSRVRFLELKNLPEDGLWAHDLRRDGVALMNHTEKPKLLVIIDPFQRVCVPSHLPRDSNDENSASIPLNRDGAQDDFRLDQIKRFRDDFRPRAQPNGPPVVIASEIPKRDNSRRDLTVDDLRGSGRMASDADNILLLWPTEDAFDGADSVPVTLRIAKGRDGVIRRDIPLIFHHTRSQFAEAERSRRDSGSADTASQTQGIQSDARQVDPLAGG